MAQKTERVILDRAHKHRGIVYPAQSEITVRKDQADRLVRQGIAHRVPTQTKQSEVSNDE